MAIGLSSGTAAALAIALLTAAGLAGILIACMREPSEPNVVHAARRIAGLAVAALAIRAGVSLLFDGNFYDVFHAYRTLGDQLRHGESVYGSMFTSASLANDPPVIYWWWAFAATVVPHGHPHLFAALVRAPFWVVDASIAPVLALLIRGRWRWRAAWLYALNPIAIAVATLHGQFDSIPALCLLLAVAWIERQPRRAAWLVGAGAAVKMWPVYFVPALLATRNRSEWPGFIARVLAPVAAAFAAYFLIHPEHIAQGIVDVFAYAPHRDNLGTSILYPSRWGDVFIWPADVGVAALILVVIVRCVRQHVAIADVVALSMLILLGLGPAISDQYLMWPMAILLLGGHHRIAALLSAALLPALLLIEIPADAPTALSPNAPVLVLATLAPLIAAAALWRATQAARRPIARTTTRAAGPTRARTAPPGRG